MSKKNERHFRKANKCYIGNKSYSEKDIWVRDDCHVIRECKCYAHRIYNANFYWQEKYLSNFITSEDMMVIS